MSHNFHLQFHDHHFASTPSKLATLDRLHLLSKADLIIFAARVTYAQRGCGGVDSSSVRSTFACIIRPVVPPLILTLTMISGACSAHSRAALQGALLILHTGAGGCSHGEAKATFAHLRFLSLDIMGGDDNDRHHHSDTYLSLTQASSSSSPPLRLISAHCCSRSIR